MPGTTRQTRLTPGYIILSLYLSASDKTTMGQAVSGHLQQHAGDFSGQYRQLWQKTQTEERKQEAQDTVEENRVKGARDTGYSGREPSERAGDTGHSGRE